MFNYRAPSTFALLIDITCVNLNPQATDKNFLCYIHIIFIQNISAVKKGSISLFPL